MFNFGIGVGGDIVMEGRFRPTFTVNLGRLRVCFILLSTLDSSDLVLRGILISLAY